jgi:hypothetical protein
MRPGLHNDAVFQKMYDISVLNSAQAMRNSNGRATPCRFVQRSLHRALGL